MSNAKFPGLKVLVVEDNILTREFLRSIFETMGAAVTTAKNGHDAVNFYKKSFYEVVFMDCHMPEMNGFEATKEMRQSSHSDGRTVIIALTAEALEGDREKCIGAGMDDYLPKPVNEEDLEKVLLRFFPDREEK